MNSKDDSPTWREHPFFKVIENNEFEHYSAVIKDLNSVLDGPEEKSPHFEFAIRVPEANFTGKLNEDKVPLIGLNLSVEKIYEVMTILMSMPEEPFTTDEVHELKIRLSRYFAEEIFDIAFVKTEDIIKEKKKEMELLANFLEMQKHNIH
jgi:hypothetical protein